MDNILFSLGAIFTSLYFIIAIFAFAAFLDHRNSQGWAAFLTGVSIWLIGRYFDLSGKEIGFMLLAYIPVGMCWSVYGWKRHVSRVILENKKKQDSDEKVVLTQQEYDSQRHKLNVYNNVGMLMIWVFGWPASLASSLCGDLIDQVELFLRKYLISIYQRISEKAIAELDDNVQVIEGADFKTASETKQDKK